MCMRNAVRNVHFCLWPTKSEKERKTTTTTTERIAYNGFDAKKTKSRSNENQIRKSDAKNKNTQTQQSSETINDVLMHNAI